MKISDQVKEQLKVLKHTVAQALEMAKSISDGVEIAITKTIGINVTTRYGEVENIKFNNDGALAINVYCQNRKASASSTNLSLDAIHLTLQAAIDIANYTSYDPYAAPADPELLAFEIPNLDLYHPWEINVDSAINMAAKAEHASLHADKRITNTEGGNFNSLVGIKVFGNNHGMLQNYCFSRYCLSSCVIAEQNGDMERSYEYTLSRSIDDLKSPEWVGIECARRVLSRLSPRKLPTMKSPVIFTSEVSHGLFGHLVNAISGSNVYRKSTFLLNSLDKKIFPEWLNIQEKPHLLKGLASAPFDSEGVRTQERYIIKNGILINWLMTNYSARKLGLQSTGHAGGIHNWCIFGKKNYSFEDLLKHMNRGLVVTEVMGQGVNIMTGDYSRGVAGYWVENGKIQYPVSEITIANNLKDMWLNIEMIGNDIDIRNDIRSGSILLPEMQIAGQ